jgi:outer membrane receptor protein involved in Fe transport
VALEPVLLPEVRVEASRLDVYLPARTDIPREELVGSHKSELSEVLDLAPGINVRNGGRGEPRLDMRGFDQRAVLFTLNGVPVYEPWNGIVNLDLFPLEMLDSVELARGPSSSLYGPNGMAGTVKMTSALPARPLMGSLTNIWRAPRTWDLRASAGATQQGFSALLGGRFLTSPGFPLSGAFDERPASRRRWEDGGLRANSDRDEQSAFADLGYKLSDDSRLHATLLGSTASFGIPPGTSEFAPVFRRNDHQEFDHAQVGLDQRLGPGLTLGAAAFYSSYSTQESQFSGPDFITKLLTTRADSDELGSIARLNAELGNRDTLSVGGQFRRDSADISDTIRGRLARPEFTTSSVAFENVYSLTSRIRLLAGLSYDLQSGGGRATDGEIDPEGGISVDFGRFGTSRAAVSRKVRFPTLRELFDPLEGNPALKAEKAVTYEVGHRVQAGQFYADASLFHIDVSDLIEKQTVGNLNIGMNLEQARLEGFEVAVGGRPAPFLQVDLNYTYLDATARDTSSGSNRFFEIQHKPAHRVNGIVQLFLPADLLLRLEGLYTSEQVDQFATNVMIKGFVLFNAQLIKGLGKHLDLFVGADNVFDEDYEEKLGSPGPGRWAYAGLRARY